MRIKLTESEKRRILGLYNPQFLFEQSSGITIKDLQILIGASPADNQLGPQTMSLLKSVLKGIPSNGCSASSTSTSTSATNTGYQPGRDPMNPDV